MSSMRRVGVFLWVLGAAVAVPMLAVGQVPGIINYQGRVVVNGTNFTGAGQFKFALVNGAGTVNYWSHDGTGAGAPATAVAITVSKGLYSVLLGQPPMVPISPAAFTNADVRLRVWFDGGNGMQQLSPDQRIGAVGYAMVAASVAAGGTIHWGTANELSIDQGGSIELGDSSLSGTVPFIDFHYGMGGNQDYNVRLINDASNHLGCSGDFSANSLSAYSLKVQKTSVAVPAIMIAGAYAGGPRLQTYGLDADPLAWMGLGTDMAGGSYEHSLYFPVGPAVNGCQTFGSYDGTDYSEKMRVTAAGRVGIGTSSPGERLDVSGNVKAAAFIGDGSGLTGLDSSQLIGALSMQPGLANVGELRDLNIVEDDLAAAGRYVYVASQGDGIFVYDVADPTKIVKVGESTDETVPWGLTIAGSYLYAACFARGLHIYDISNPTNPVTVAATNDGGYSYNVAIAGNYAYLTHSDDGLRVYDISDPAHPLFVGQADQGADGFQVAVAGGYAYLTGYSTGLYIYDLSNPASPLLTGHIYEGQEFSIGVAVQGSFAYLACPWDGLRIYNIADPANPFSVARITNDFNAVDVALAGSTLYVGCQGSSSGIRAYDVSDPVHPVAVRTLGTPSSEGSLSLAGDYAYLGTIRGFYVCALSVLTTTAIQCDSITPSGAGLTIHGTVSAAGFSGNGAGLTNLNGGSISSGTIPDARLSANVARLDGSQTFSGTLGVSNLTMKGQMWMNGNDLFLRSDRSHGLGWYGSAKLFGGVNLDGPALYGYSGGALGSVHGVTTNIALQWDGNRSVTMNNDVTISDTAVIQGTTTINGDAIMNAKVGIGRLPSANKLEVEGEASKTTAGSWLANSDARIKTEIVTVTNALETLDKVRLVSFRYTDQYQAEHPSIADRRYLNVIAQEFQTVFPDAVKGSGEKLPDGSDVLQVDPWPLTIYSAAAVQELERKNVNLQRQIDELKALIEKMGKEQERKPQ